MKEKFLQLMKSEGLTSSRMAEMLEIQPSGISHILAGRNKPGFDLLQKILRRFPRVNPDWLLLDSGPMYRMEEAEAHDPVDASSAAGASLGGGLFEAAPGASAGNENGNGILQESATRAEETRSDSRAIIQTLADGYDNPQNPIVRVILVYADRSFDALTLRKP